MQGQFTSVGDADVGSVGYADAGFILQVARICAAHAVDVEGCLLVAQVLTAVAGTYDVVTGDTLRLEGDAEAASGIGGGSEHVTHVVVDEVYLHVLVADTAACRGTTDDYRLVWLVGVLCYADGGGERRDEPEGGRLGGVVHIDQFLHRLLFVDDGFQLVVAGEVGHGCLLGDGLALARSYGALCIEGGQQGAAHIEVYLRLCRQVDVADVVHLDGDFG